MNQDNWKTPLGYYEKALEDLQIELIKIKQFQAEYTNFKQELENTQTELKMLKEKFNLIQTVNNNLSNNEQKKSIFVKAENWQNATCEATWQTVVKYQLQLEENRQINIIGNGHGYASNYNSPLQIGIFINGVISDTQWYGIGITQSPNWQTLFTIASVNLKSGEHLIELKYHSRHGNGVNWVHFNGGCMIVNS